VIARDTRSLPPQVLENLRRPAVAAVESRLRRCRSLACTGCRERPWASGSVPTGPRTRIHSAAASGAGAPATSWRFPHQQAWLVKTIGNGPPNKTGLNHQLWTRVAVAELIEREFRVTRTARRPGSWAIRRRAAAPNPASGRRSPSGPANARRNSPPPPVAPAQTGPVPAERSAVVMESISRCYWNHMRRS
jgi:hypothetical protein